MTAPIERILLVDDEDNQRVPLRKILESWGYEVEDCSSVKQALERIGVFLPSVVITDLVMPVASGIDLIREIRDDYRGSVIVLSGKGTIEKAVEAIKEGADDFLEKPLNFEKLRLVLARMRERTEIVEENRRLRELLAKEGTFGRLRGRSKKMLEVYNIIEQVAPSQIPVLITGESGTGKELVARTIHEMSSRRKGPFVAINAAAIPRELIESELFGHERGAFTGAIARKFGCFEMAHQGTLFLDEIAEMEESTQAKLLRVLQEQNFRRIGGSDLIQADVRVLAATNREPKLAMQERKLRKDLYYRLAVMTVHLPPLRERSDDIQLLARGFADEVCASMGKRVADFDTETGALLTRYRWPGNVRELRNSIERALVLSSGPSIVPEDLPDELLTEVGYHPGAARMGSARAVKAAERAASSGEARAGSQGSGTGSGAAWDAGAWKGAGAGQDSARSIRPMDLPGTGTGDLAAAGAVMGAGGADGSSGSGLPGETRPGPEGGDAAAGFTVPLGASAADVERELIRRTLEMTRGNKTRAAKILGLSLKTIHNKAKKYGL